VARDLFRSARCFAQQRQVGANETVINAWPNRMERRQRFVRTILVSADEQDTVAAFGEFDCDRPADAPRSA
jgi:hypothetical protein